MPLLISTFDSNLLHEIIARARDHVPNQPFNALVVFGAAALAGYALKRPVCPDPYSNINGPPSDGFLSGHLMDIWDPDSLPFHDRLQDTYGSVARLKVAFGGDALYTSDPRFLHEVLVKEVDSAFASPQSAYDILNVIFGPGLLATRGDLHKAQRKMLNPVFTSKHMKEITHTFNVIAQRMRAAMILDMNGAESKEVDMLRWCSSAALELIGQAGHSFGVLEGAESTYSTAIKSFGFALLSVTPFRPLFPFFYNLRPRALQRKLADWAPNSNIRKLKEIIDVQEEQAQTLLSQKKQALKDDATSEGMSDIMSSLLNSEADETSRLPEDQLLGQMNTLIFAGHETTSGALARVLHLLSMDKSVQDRLRLELDGASESPSYEEIHSLPYLDAICRETLRLFPPVPFLDRQALKDCTVPLRYPVKGKNGEEIREIRIKKGTAIYLGLRGANRSKETWGEEADVFRPERWLEKLPSSVGDARTSGIYSSIMTFSAGPRSCIGYKFSILKLKIILTMLVRSFRFTPGTTSVSWFTCGTMIPYPPGTKNRITEGEQPFMPLTITALRLGGSISWCGSISPQL